MRSRAESSKLAELRSKTDRELFVLLDRQLDAALSFTHHDGELMAAEEVYAQVNRWVALVQSLPHAELRQVEKKLAQLRERIYGRLQTACA
jgi:hypothetical protein